MTTMDMTATTSTNIRPIMNHIQHYCWTKVADETTIN